MDDSKVTFHPRMHSSIDERRQNLESETAVHLQGEGTVEGAVEHLHEEGTEGAEGDSHQQGGDNSIQQEFKQLQQHLMGEFRQFFTDTKHHNEEVQRQITRDIRDLRSDLEGELNNLKRRFSQLEEHENRRDTSKQTTSYHTSSPLQTQNLEGSSPYPQRVNTVTHHNESVTDVESRGVTLTASSNQNSNVHHTEQRSSHTNSAKGSNYRKAQIYTGSEDLEEYLAQFQIISELNNWDYATRSLQLAGSLSGSARAVLSELSQTERRDYDSITKALNTRFGSIERAEIFRARLQTRAKGKDETIPELALAIRKLTRQAYPCASDDLRKILALDHFIDALPDADMRLRLRESHPKNIGEAETQAIRLETHRLADKQRGRMVRNIECEQVNNAEVNVSHTGPPENSSAKVICDVIRQEFKEMKENFGSLTHEIKDLTKGLKSMNRNNHPQNRQVNRNAYRNNQGQNQGGRNFYNQRPNGPANQNEWNNRNTCINQGYYSQHNRQNMPGQPAYLQGQQNNQQGNMRLSTSGARGGQN